MERVMVVLVLLALAMLNAGASTQDNTTTLEDIYFEENREMIHEYSLRRLSRFNDELEEKMTSNVTDSVRNVTTLPLKEDILDYIKTMTFNLLEEMSTNVGSIPVQSIYDDLTYNCGDHLESPIVNLTVEPSNVTCVSNRLRTILTRVIGAGLQNFTRQCIQQRLTLCRKVDANCTTAYEERVANLLRNYTMVKVTKVEGPTPLKIIEKFLLFIARFVFVPYSSAYTLIAERELPTSGTNSSIQSHEQLVWRIFKSDAHRTGLVCSHYIEFFWGPLENYPESLYMCYTVNMFQSNLDLFRCLNTNETLSPVTVPSFTNHTSQ